MSSHLVLTMHAYIPEPTVTLTKYYRNIVNMVNGITMTYMCIKHLKKLQTHQDIDSKESRKNVNCSS